MISPGSAGIRDPSRLTWPLSPRALALGKPPQQHLGADVLHVLLELLMHLEEENKKKKGGKGAWNNEGKMGMGRGPLTWGLTWPICTWVSSTECE